MRKILIFGASFVLLAMAGCSKETTISKVDTTNDEMITTEHAQDKKAVVKEDALTTAEKENSQETTTENTTQEEKTSEAEKPTTAATMGEQPKGETPKSETPTTAQPATEAPKVVAYDPNQVVALATAKTKAYGKISIPEDLDRMLANGEITQEEYNRLYPYDGAGYYSVFVETDLNEASTTSGRKLGSVEGIADHIAGMLALETGPYFYIEYAGTTTTGGVTYYEFRCYRA